MNSKIACCVCALTLSLSAKTVTVSEGTNIAATVSPDQKTIVMDLQGTLFALPFSGGAAKRIIDPMMEPARPDFSPKGGLIAFQAYKGGTFHIWTMKPDGSDLAQLTGAEGEDEAPAWSPDGSKIAFASNRDGGTSLIYLMNADGSGVERLSTGANAERDPAWSPDGRFVVFARSDSNSVLVIVDVSTREVVSTMSQARTEWSYPAWRKP